MDKRWVSFFLVFTAAYFLLIVPMIRPSVEDAEPAEDFAAEVVPATERERPTADAAPDRPRTDTTDTAEATAEERDTPVALPAIPDYRISLDDADTEFVATPVANVVFSNRGGVPISWELLPTDRLAEVRNQETGTTIRMELIPQVSERENRDFPFQLEGRGLDEFNRVAYEVERTDREDGGVVLRYTSPMIDGLRVIKTYVFEPESYIVGLEVAFESHDVRVRIGDPERGWGIGWMGGFMQPEPGSRIRREIVQAVTATDQSLRTRRVGFDDPPYTYTRYVAWAGQERKYLAATIIPEPANPAMMAEVVSRRRNNSPEYNVRGIDPPMNVIVRHPAVEIQSNATEIFRYSLFVGPKDYNMLRDVSRNVPMIPEGLPLSAITFGDMPLGQNWLRPISLVLLKSLRWFEGLVNNWGLAIILLVLVVKTILYPLSHWAIKNQAKTMAEQAKLKPHLDAINKKYKEDPQRRSQEMMKLYREHNINPLGMLRGCFPILLQMPIFFALYILLDQAVELRGQSFLWIQDLAAPDRLIPFGFTIPLLGWSAFNILPVLMAITQYFTSRLMMTNVTDPMQRQIMLFMPIIFTVLLYNMPAGLMLYWTVQNVWQIGHTVLTKRYVATHDTPTGGTPAKAATA